jgi:hypothetical protein
MDGRDHAHHQLRNGKSILLLLVLLRSHLNAVYLARMCERLDWLLLMLLRRRIRDRG